jgi:tetratricopeptide (TPR) repeat protein
LAVTAQVLSDWLKIKSYAGSILRWITRTATVGNFVALGGTLISVVVVVLIVQELARNVVIVAPIAVPKDLADSGYTQDVASRRLGDALKAYAGVDQRASHELSGAGVDQDDSPELGGAYITSLTIQAGDERPPDFVVPQIGLSLEAIVASIRSVLHHRRGQTISGELIFHDNKYALRVRVDDRIVFDSKFDSENPDDLLTRAAPRVLEQVQPYLSARAEARDNPDQAYQKAEDIIASRSESDPNVQGAHLLKGNYWLKKGNFELAANDYSEAIRLNWGVAGPHNQLGVLLQRRGEMLQRQGDLDAALTQFQRAVSIAPNWHVGYNNAGWVLARQAQLAQQAGSKLDDPNVKHLRDKARAKYLRAIELKPHYALAHSGLGSLLSDEERINDAIEEFRLAIKFDEKDARAHQSLANALLKKSDYDGALAEFRVAIDTTNVPRNLAILHTWIGDVLALKVGAEGEFDEIIAEYQRAIEIDSTYSWAHNNLGMILRDQGKLDDAIAEFGAAKLAAPKNDLAAIKAANENLDQIQQARDKAVVPSARLKEQAQPPQPRKDAKQAAQAETK